MSVAEAPFEQPMPLGGYWKMPLEEQAAFRRTMRDLWHWPANRTPTDRQLLLMLSSYNRSMRQPIFFGGAMGGGKSSGLCSLAIHLARVIPGNRVLMCRKEFSAFSASTLQELQEQIEACPDARLWEGKHEVHFDNGSEIWYMGVGTPKQREKLGSTQFGAILPDEATEIERDVIRMLQTRLRWKPAAKAKRLVLAMTGNPYPGWIKESFVKDPSAAAKGYTFIPALARDNPYLYEGYIDDMKAEMPDEWYQAFILGNWDALVPTTAAIPYKLVEEARRRKEVKDTTDIVWGIDLGHLGTDASAVAARYGHHFETVDMWHERRIDESAVYIRNLFEVSVYQPRRLVFDYDGIGAGVADIFLGWQEQGEFPRDVQIIGLHAQKTASVENPYGFASMRYANMKAQNAFQFRRMLERGHGDLPDEEMLEQDLTTANYDIIDGRIYIESKKLVRSRLGRSPDLGDAYLLTMTDMSGDEFAGLPSNADDQVAQLEAREAAELVELQKQQEMTTFYQQPFRQLGVRISVPNIIDVDQTVGY